MFYDIFKTSNFLKSWKEGDGIAIPKPSKIRYDLKSYLPISFLSLMPELMERVILKRIEPLT